VGGISRVRARRIFPDGQPADANPFFLTSGNMVNEFNARVVGFGTNFFTSWEHDRNTATSGLDIFARVVPDMGPVPSDVGTPIVTAPFRQTQADLAIIGASGLTFAWQDQRLGPGVDENVWRERFTTSIQPSGTEALVTGAPNDQIQPRIAGDA